MIPKKIHYIWLGKQPIPKRLQSCIDTWKIHMPDYEIIKHTEKDYDIEANKLANATYKKQFYSITTDPMRTDILYNEGGFYFDTDFELYKSLDTFRKNKCFLVAEGPLRINKEEGKPFYRPDVPFVMSAVMGCEKNHSFMKIVLDFYNNIPDDLFNVMKWGKPGFIMPCILKELLYAHYGFLNHQKDKEITDEELGEQILENDTHIHPRSTIANYWKLDKFDFYGNHHAWSIGNNESYRNKEAKKRKENWRYYGNFFNPIIDDRADAEFVISVVSKDRPTGNTFNIIKDAKCPIYVFVHIEQEAMYRKALPDNYIIVPHYEDTIGEIRNYVAAYQAKRNNVSLVLDDDIIAIYNSKIIPNEEYPATINDVIYAIKSMQDVDLGITVRQNSIKDENVPNFINYSFPLGGSYVVYPHFFIKMNEGKWENEDIDGFLQYIWHDTKIGLIDYVFFMSRGEYNKSHFNKDWRLISIVNLYKKYGDLFTIHFDESKINTNPVFPLELSTSMHFEFDYIKENGVAYKDFSNETIHKMIKYYSDNPVVLKQLKLIWKEIENKPIRPRNSYCPSFYYKF